MADVAVMILTNAREDDSGDSAMLSHLSWYDWFRSINVPEQQIDFSADRIQLRSGDIASRLKKFFQSEASKSVLVIVGTADDDGTLQLRQPSRDRDGHFVKDPDSEQEDIDTRRGFTPEEVIESWADSRKSEGTELMVYLDTCFGDKFCERAHEALAARRRLRRPEVSVRIQALATGELYDAHGCLLTFRMYNSPELYEHNLWLMQYTDIKNRQPPHEGHIPVYYNCSPPSVPLHDDPELWLPVFGGELTDPSPRHLQPAVLANTMKRSRWRDAAKDLSLRYQIELEVRCFKVDGHDDNMMMASVKYYRKFQWREGTASTRSDGEAKTEAQRRREHEELAVANLRDLRSKNPDPNEFLSKLSNEFEVELEDEDDS